MYLTAISFGIISLLLSICREISGAAECGLIKASSIIGGHQAIVHEFPWMAVLFVKTIPGDLSCTTYNTRAVICGGTLITDRHVLSAAHCFNDMYYASDFMIRLGASHLPTDETYRAMYIKDFHPVAVQIHEYFDRTTTVYDIAIITLDKRTSFMPICLPYGYTDQSFEGYTSTVAGFGKTSTASSRGSPSLMKVRLKVVSNSQCSQAFAKQRVPINAGQICAGFYSGEKDSCQGDSGGPMMLSIDLKWYLIGIVSMGYKCAQPGYYGIYTRTTYFMDWIQPRLT